MMEFSTCPSCGLQALQIVAPEGFDPEGLKMHNPITGSRTRQNRASGFSCQHCRWSGNTATVNMF